MNYAVEFKFLRKGHVIPRTSLNFKLDPFIGTDGLLWIKGTLQMSDLSYDEIHPIIFPNGQLAKLAVQYHYKQFKYAGVDKMIYTMRYSYWIVGLRYLARQVKKECFSWQKFYSQICSQPTTPLPADRAHKFPIFTVTGIYFAGPLFVVIYLAKSCILFYSHVLG